MYINFNKYTITLRAINYFAPVYDTYLKIITVLYT